MTSEASVFQDLFVERAEKDQLAQWKQTVVDHSLVNQAISPFFHWLSGFVPDGVAPSLLTLCGSAALIQSWYFCANGAEGQALLTHGTAILSISLFWVLGSLDVKTADRIAGDTPVAELFRYVCGLVCAPFIVSMVCTLVCQRACPETHWYLVQTMQMLLFLKHYSAFKREVALSYSWVGPGELLAGALGLLLISVMFGQTVVQSAAGITFGLVLSPLQNYVAPSSVDAITAHAVAKAACMAVFALTLLVLAGSRKSRPHGWTRTGLSAAFVLRAVAAMVRFASLGRVASTPNDAIFDALFIAMMTADIIVAKMSGRGMHTWIVPMALMVLLPQWQSLTVVFCSFYIIATFCDLVMHTNLPLFQVVTNVYCDGIYDLCHMGHKNAFERALRHGNRLFVGVVGDEDANNYKRPPIMSALEREREVFKCKGVTKVIQNAPCFGLTEEFIKKHNIHVVCFGREYLERYSKPEDDPYYKVPRQMGIAVPVDRYSDMSTTDIIQRILARGSDSKKSPT